jgi:hypothetical protein
MACRQAVRLFGHRHSLTYPNIAIKCVGRIGLRGWMAENGSRRRTTGKLGDDEAAGSAGELKPINLSTLPPGLHPDGGDFSICR